MRTGMRQGLFLKEKDTLIYIKHLLVLSLFALPAWGTEAPYLVRIEQATVVYAPNGSRIDIPAGSEIDVCITNQQIVTTPEDGPPRITYKAGIEYSPDARSVIVTEPCPERPLFTDGFE